MSNPLWLHFNTPDEFPSLADVARLVTPSQHVVLRYPSVGSKEEVRSQKQNIVAAWQRDLPDLSIFDSGGEAGIEWITLMWVVKKDDVLSHADEIVEAASQFRILATSLMNTLAITLDVPIDAFDDIAYRYKIPRWSFDGRLRNLNNNWRYGFHGYECHFTHSITRQKLDIRLGFVTEDGTEFGVLDSFFFHEFLASTPTYHHLAALLPHAFHDTARALETLEQHGFLDKITVNGRSGSIIKGEP